MPFIGVISEENVENCIHKQLVKKMKLNESSILFIKEKSIDNIKNIKFETIVMTREFKDIKTLKKILENATYIIINTDIVKDLKFLGDIKATLITYGFNSKATITASSVGDDEIMICVQRNFKNKNGKTIELQEIKEQTCENSNCTMAVAATLLIYKK